MDLSIYGFHARGQEDVIDNGQLTIPTRLPAQEKPTEEETPKVSAAKLSYEEQKAQARLRKKLEKALQEAETKVTELEQAISILESQMATPEGSQDIALYEKHGRMKEQLAKAEEEWEAAMEAMEE